jgi:riboflavin synthase
MGRGGAVMFQGIIEHTATFISLSKKKNVFELNVLLDAKAAKYFSKSKVGDSIAIDGTCLSLIRKKGKNFFFDLIPETISKTKYKTLKKGDVLNLENPLTLNTPISGHIVTGHVDTVGTVQKISPQNEVFIEFPKQFQKWITPKGSITVNGISLTVASLKKNKFSIALIPITRKITNLGQIQLGNLVNLEFDYLVKMIKK